MLSFQDYYFSDDEDEYKKEMNQTPILIKQMKQLIREDEKNLVNLGRMTNNIILLKNTFVRESILEFFNTKFSKDELKKVGDIIYEMLVNQRDGIISNHKKYADEVFKLMKVKGLSRKVKKVWETYKDEIKMDGIS